MRLPASISPGENICAHVEIISVKEVNDSLELIKKITVEIEISGKPACVAEIVTSASLG